MSFRDDAHPEAGKVQIGRGRVTKVEAGKSSDEKVSSNSLATFDLTVGSESTYKIY
jgi:hypothetical protein